MVANKEEYGFFDDWPEWAKPTMALAAMILLGGAWIGAPLLIAWQLMKQNTGATAMNFQPLTTVLVAMTTATIAGIFLFMTFRIDRGTRLKAESVAKREIEKRTTEEIRKRIQEALSEVDTFVGETGPRAVCQQVAAYLRDEDVRRQIESVLTVDANVQIVQEYARRRVGDFNLETIQQLAELMGDTAKALRRLAWAERARRRSGAIKAFFRKLVRSSEKGSVAK